MEAGVHAAFPLPNQTFLPSSPPCWTCLSPGPADLANISSPGWRNPRLARLDSAFKPTLIWAPVVLTGLQMEAQCAWCLDHGEETKTLSVIHQFLPIHRVLGLGNQIDENEVPVLRKLPVHQGSRKEGWDREVIIEARGQWTGDVFGKTPQGFAFASPLLTIDHFTDSSYFPSSNPEVPLTQSAVPQMYNQIYKTGQSNVYEPLQIRPSPYVFIHSRNIYRVPGTVLSPGGHRKEARQMELLPSRSLTSHQASRS